MHSQGTWTHQKTLSNSVSVEGDRAELKDLMRAYHVQSPEEAEYGHGEYDSSWTYEIQDGYFQMAGPHPRDFVTSSTEYEEPIVLLAQMSEFFDEELELMFIGDFEDHGSELEAEKWILKNSRIEYIGFKNSRRRSTTGYSHREFEIDTILAECSEYISERNSR